MDGKSTPMGSIPDMSGHLSARLLLGLRRKAETWGPPLSLILVGVLMLQWTWGTWPDVLVDFGPELYVPWQLSEGKALYRDIAHFKGPLSTYFNSAVFSLFQASLRVVVICNLVIVALIMVLLHRVLVRISHWWAAWAACLVFILLFAFGHFVTCGNYNYVCPYSHEMTHGLLLSLLGLLSIWSYSSHGLTAIAAGGLSLGLAFLTRSEVFAASAAGTLSALALTIWALRPGARRAVAILGTFIGAAALPAVVAMAMLSQLMPPGQAWQGILETYLAAANPELREMAFFRASTGTDDVRRSLSAMTYTLGWTGLVFVPAAALSWIRLRNRFLRTLWVCVVGGASATVTYHFAAMWLGEAFRPLPLVLATITIVLLVRLIRTRRKDRQAIQPLLWRLSFVVFALVLLMKMVLFARIYQYGFVLAMPAAMVFVVAVLDWAPRSVARLGGNAWCFRAASVGWLLAVTAVYLAHQQMVLNIKTTVIAPGTPDEFRCDLRGRFVMVALEQFEKRSRPGDTLAVLPEGATLNFLYRRANPTAHPVVMPTEMILFGEGRILRSFQEHPPDWIAYVHKDTAEYGYPFFGRDYCRQLDGWIQQNYAPTVLIGNRPFQSPGAFGILLLKKARR